jgi:hypothetical protein
MGRCAVCRSPQVALIDRDLDSGEKSRKIIAEEYAQSQTALARHMDHRRRQSAFLAATNAAQRTRADHTSKEARTHRALDSLLSGTSIVSELRTIKARADRLAAAAEASGEPDTAIKALREMTRIIELQARLALEASQGRSADVSAHPVFHEAIGVIVQALSGHPLAAQCVVSALREKLGIDVPLTIATPALTEGLPFPSE